MENTPLHLAAMKKTLILIIMPLLLLGKTQAQEQDTLLIDQPLRHHAVTIDPLTFYADACLLTYEYALPHRSSLEVELGAQGFQWKKLQGVGAITRPGIATTIGYKFYFPAGKRSKAMARAGSLPRVGYFVKPRLTYVHQWSSYDVYAGNVGWDIVTQRTTLHENYLSLGIILGRQFVSRHGFVFSPYIGYNFPLWLKGPFHTTENPSSSAVYYGFATLGMKFGWAF